MKRSHYVLVCVAALFGILFFAFLLLIANKNRFFVVTPLIFSCLTFAAMLAALINEKVESFLNNLLSYNQRKSEAQSEGKRLLANSHYLAKEINTTVNVITFFSSYQLLLENFQRLKEIEKFLKITGLPPERQIEIFTATIPKAIDGLVDRLLADVGISSNKISEKIQRYNDAVIYLKLFKSFSPDKIDEKIRFIEQVVTPNLIEQQGGLANVTDGFQFEEYIADLLTRSGYDKAERTSGSGDFGADVIAVKNGVKFALQCKFYSRPVGNSAVNEVLGGMKYYNCHVGIVVTNNTFTRAANEIAKQSNVLLWDIETLTKMEKANPLSTGTIQTQNNISDEKDELFDQAIDCVVEAGHASTSMLQRRLRVGYARASRLIDEMEHQGIIGSDEHGKPREVLITRQQWLETKPYST